MKLPDLYEYNPLEGRLTPEDIEKVQRLVANWAIKNSVDPKETYNQIADMLGFDALTRELTDSPEKSPKK